MPGTSVSDPAEGVTAARLVAAADHGASAAPARIDEHCLAK
jgi:hypothetical protein